MGNDTYWIRIDPVHEYITGEFPFDITARTNLPVDDDVVITVLKVPPHTEGHYRQQMTGSIKVIKGGQRFNETLYQVSPGTLTAGSWIASFSAGDKGPANVSEFQIVPTP